MQEPQRYNPAKWKEFLAQIDNRQHDKRVYDTYREDLKHSLRSQTHVRYSHKQMIPLTHYFDYYKKATSVDFDNENYLKLDEKNLKVALSQCKVLVLTANPVEKAVFHYLIRQQTREKIRRILCDDAVYFILRWGKYWVAHVQQIETGAYKDYGTNTALHKALTHFTPNVIFSLGVAFGIDFNSQKIGDVIVSKKVLPYSENKRDEDFIKPDRNQDKVIDNWLHVRFLNSTGFLESVTYGDVLTGGSVMSSFEEKDKVCLGYTKNDFVIGGEMEGSALFQYAKTEGIPGAIIKGICDWGVAKNDVFDDAPEKEEEFKCGLQAYAMAMAVEKATLLFSDKTLFEVPKSYSNRMLGKRYKLAKHSLAISLLLMFLTNVMILFPKFSMYEISSNTWTFIAWGLVVFVFVVLFVNARLPMAILWGFKRMRARAIMKKTAPKKAVVADTVDSSKE